MCGIAGKYGVRILESGEAGQLADAFQDALSRRGPDGWRYHHDENVVLVHRRLAIIDLSDAGSQPMWNEDHTICVIVNGEIYNYRELRQWLHGHGHRFRSDSDSEVLVHLYEQGGIDHCCNRIQGMFAFALWDARMRQLYLVRDRLGIKPLVISEHAGGVSFASTLPALLRDREVPRDVRDEALIALLKWGFVPTPWSAVQSARRIEPGTYVCVRDGRVRSERRWWVDKPGDEGGGEALVRQAVERAVASHLAADVPVGVLLSAGIDSGIVAGLAAKHGGAPDLEAWTVRHSGFVEDEFAGAAQAAEFFEIPCHPIDVGGCLTEDLFDGVVRAMDEPLAVSSLVGLHSLFRAIAPSRKVILTGDGGDELFAGYDWHSGMPMVPTWARGPSFTRVARFLAPLARLPGKAGTLGNVAAHARRDPACVYLDKLRITRDDVLARLGIAPLEEDPMERRASAAWKAYEQGETLDRMLAVDRATALVDEMLAKVDTAAMAHGIEARVPLLADDVVSAAKCVRPEMKRRGDMGKIMLRAWYAEIGPPGLAERRKTGFNSPVASWFIGESGEFLRDRVHAGLRLFGARGNGDDLSPRTRFALAVTGAWVSVATSSSCTAPHSGSNENGAQFRSHLRDLRSTALAPRHIEAGDE